MDKMDKIMTFGMYKGKSLEWIYDNDPDYFLWLVGEEIINVPQWIIDSLF